VRRALVALAALLIVRALLIRIGPTEVGVRTDNLALLGGRGVAEEDFGPGWHISVPIINTWNVFPARVRRVSLTTDTVHRGPNDTDALLVQSSDGDRVMLDIDLFFRVLPGSAHSLLLDSGPGDAHMALLMSLASDQLRVVYGTLRAEQFYDPVARGGKTEEALGALNGVLNPRFLEVVDVALRDIRFEPKYEQKIKDKKLADQNVELSKAQARSGAERAKVAAIELETTRQVELIKTQAEAEVARLRAEAAKYQAEKQGSGDVYKAEQAAEGTLALGRAEARVRRAKTSALTGSGGANYAALEAVGNLNLDTVQFPTSGGDWFDVQSMAKQLGARP
jgi:regulator of protease activity HflC (stomatin/prohibitin superfamily)